ncbi:MAG: 50S ribosomal protein L11 methyltransferase [Thermoleophilia bacterium]|nr:50S ribosomal protein L11 methyltransferase [Thermoleophilia bacterium]
MTDLPRGGAAQTAPTAPTNADLLVEVAVFVDAPQAELAAYATGEFSPGGFQEEEQADGRTRLAVFVKVGDEARYTAWLAQAGITILGDAITTEVPGDWSERWKEFHQAITIGTLWVGPPWQLGDAPAELKKVVIEPAQGFGTGAHPTTRLVLSLLEQQPRSSVLDVGCGSGVLTVAAAKLGFGPLTAIDNDPVAVESTLENLERNDVRGVTTRVSDALQQELPSADLVLANVIYEPLVRLAPRMRAPRLILSGLLKSQAEDIEAVYRTNGYVLRERRDRDGWVALVFDSTDVDGAAMRTRDVF